MNDRDDADGFSTATADLATESDGGSIEDGSDERDGRRVADDDRTRESATVSSDDSSGGRDIVVPLRLYKTVTVFSTLIAVVGILGGFVLLDVATNRAQADFSDVNFALALLGIGLIAGGSITYAFSTRFRTAGMGTRMGNAKDDADEHSDTDNG